MISGFILASPFDVLATYVPANVEDTPSVIGGVAMTTDGRRFRLGYNATTSTTLAACKNTQGPVQSSSYSLGTVSAQNIGDTSITYTFNGGAASVVVNYFTGGLLSIVTGTGSPQTVQIKGNPAVTSSTTIVLQLQDPLVLATSASATANIWANPYSGVIICPTTLTGTVTGVNQVAIPGSTWGWFLTDGLGTCLGQGTTAQGLDMGIGSVAGSLAVSAATTQRVASADQAGADTLYTFVNMKLS
jgi:hypothetical protein